MDNFVPFCKNQTSINKESTSEEKQKHIDSCEECTSKIIMEQSTKQSRQNKYNLLDKELELLKQLVIIHVQHCIKPDLSCQGCILIKSRTIEIITEQTQMVHEDPLLFD